MDSLFSSIFIELLITVVAPLVVLIIFFIANSARKKRNGQKKQIENLTANALDSNEKAKPEYERQKPKKSKERAKQAKPHKNRSLLYTVISWSAFALIWISLAVYSAGAHVPYFAFFIPGGGAEGNHGIWEAFSFLAFISIICFFLFGFFAFSGNFPKNKAIKYLTVIQFGVTLAVYFILATIEKIIEFLATKLLHREFNSKLPYDKFLKSNYTEVSKSRDYELENLYNSLTYAAYSSEHSIQIPYDLKRKFAEIGYNGGAADYSVFEDRHGNRYVCFDGKTILPQSDYEKFIDSMIR